MKKISYRITTTPDELREGLFGQIVLFVFEILPYLHSRSIFPAWDIKSRFYGTAPDYNVIPGVFDPAYALDANDGTLEMTLTSLRKDHVSVLGNDWKYLHELWRSYFKIPERITAAADRTGDLSNTLGIHFRGTDKNLSDLDTNPVTQDEFVVLMKDFLKNHPDITSIFIATDEYRFVTKVKSAFGGYDIINLGEVSFHLANAEDSEKGDRAVLDCLLLSRCKYLLKASSALSGFAKVLNPDLESYRVSASKFFADIPYFPDAYIPKLTTNDKDCDILLKRLFTNDWLENKRAKELYGARFATKKRSRLRLLINTTFKWISYYQKAIINKMRS